MQHSSFDPQVLKLFSLLLFLCFVQISVAQTSSFVGRQSNAIYNTVKRYHYAPIPLDDDFSKSVFENYLNEIDPGGYYFLKADIEELKQFETTIDNEIESKSDAFFKKSAELFKVRLKAVDSLIHVLEATKFDLTKDEVLSFADADYPDYLDDYTQLKERWRKWLKYSIMDELFTNDYFEDPMNESLSNLLTKVDEAKKDAFDYEYYNIKSYLEHPAGYTQFLATFYLDAIATNFDPHTTYFSDVEKENFVEELSKENLIFGISVEEDENGVVHISDLVPGSPAWNSNLVNVGDQLLSIGLSDGQHLEMTKAGVDEIQLMFSNSNAETLTLELRKANGEELTVELVRGEVYIEDDVIKNLILQGDKKIGYITLPDFYTNWDGSTGLGCANDVAKTIIKLQKENIQGLIIDLRYNGGGSLKEAIDLAGIFIDWGPLAISKDKYGEATSIKDMNKGAIYTGPLLILVNGLSASASEIFAAAMQDYNRAIIAGSATYGKSSSQIILPLDPEYKIGFSDVNAVDPLYGYLKVTTDKFYRITKETHQRTGVVPQILMPDIYDIYDYKESSYENALSADVVDKQVYYTPFENFAASILEESKKRISSNANFMRMTFLIDSLNNDAETDENIDLNLERYQRHERLLDLLYTELFDLEESLQSPYKATNNLYDLEIMKMDAYRSKLNDAYLKKIESDIYINEAYHVLIDYLK